jgi:MFS-type transporter involved in bile tolerance (Atg22 family)
VPAGGIRRKRIWRVTGKVLRFHQMNQMIVTALSRWHYTFAFVFATFASASLFTNCNSALQRSVRPSKVGRAGGLFISSYYAAAAVSGFAMAKLVNYVGWENAALIQFTVVPGLTIGILWFVDSSKIIRKHKASK